MACLALTLPASAADQPSKSSTDPRVQRLSAYYPYGTAAIDESRIVVVDDGVAQLSADDGRVLETVTMPRDPDSKLGVPRSGPLLRTSDGTLVLIYIDAATRHLSWDEETGEPKPDMRADVWSVRSVDGGKTWTDRQEVSALFHHISPYCISLIQLTEAADGTLIVPMQLRVGNFNRSVLSTAISRDKGKTWIASTSVLDIGGAGVHDGLLEPALVDLGDGRVWMLIRTNLDYFYQSFSRDSGMTWSSPVQTDIPASSSPGFVLRLKSGRLMMLWNRLAAEGRTDYPTRSGKKYSSRVASWHRDELSIAFSDDNAKTWSAPTVIVRDAGNAAYPSAFERRPGEIWVSINYPGKASFRLFEKDFVGKKAAR